MSKWQAHYRLALVWADGGYTGSLVEHCLAAFSLALAIVKRSDDMRGFVVLLSGYALLCPGGYGETCPLSASLRSRASWSVLRRGLNAQGVSGLS
ncbi:hypothetical protein ACWCQS_21465 [Streptomyces sp. NPDC002076]